MGADLGVWCPNVARALNVTPLWRLTIPLFYSFTWPVVWPLLVSETCTDHHGETAEGAWIPTDRPFVRPIFYVDNKCTLKSQNSLWWKCAWKQVYARKSRPEQTIGWRCWLTISLLHITKKERDKEMGCSKTSLDIKTGKDSWKYRGRQLPVPTSLSFSRPQGKGKNRERRRHLLLCVSIPLMANGWMLMKADLKHLHTKAYNTPY